MTTRMEKVSVSLTPDLSQRIAAKLETGGYASASEYVRAALRDRLAYDEEMDVMRARYRTALDDHVNGRTLSHDDVFAELRAEAQRLQQ